jgi:hypothetical protein
MSFHFHIAAAAAAAGVWTTAAPAISLPSGGTTLKLFSVRILEELLE